jgi:hypothetical protein
LQHRTKRENESAKEAIVTIVVVVVVTLDLDCITIISLFFWKERKKERQTTLTTRSMFIVRKKGMKDGASFLFACLVWDHRSIIISPIEI